MLGHWMEIYPVDTGPASCSKVGKRCTLLDMHVIGFPNTYPLDSDLSEG